MEVQLWKELLSPYELAVKELTVKFEHIISEYHQVGRHCPIEQVTGRVKTISGILEKARKKNIPFEQITEQIEDIAGLRIICQFVEDIYVVVGMLRQRSDMKISTEDDYIKHIKPSGYRSYHVIIQYEVQSAFGCKVIPVEIQIRTLAMNFWAIIEHSLQYKYAANIPEDVRQRLSAAADAVVLLDEEMTTIRNEIMDAQTSFRTKANIVSDILNNIRNLSKVIDENFVLGLQDEFFELYNEGNLIKLAAFAGKLDSLAQEYNVQTIDRIE